MQHVLPIADPQPACVASSAPTLIRLIVEQVEIMLEVRRQRRALLAMSDAMLHDIGISRADAEGEAMRPFWDVPASWH
jgi:uncharacterized protein YjiS (DUF1127 family)